jgi:NADH-quinone oxidoreductase subunit G
VPVFRRRKNTGVGIAEEGVEKNMNVKITVDGKTIEAEAGRTLIDVLNENGFDIPHFCYHPGLGPDGNCRMCQVEIITPRGPLLTISCNSTVTDGMEVVTNSDRVKRARAAVEEFLLLNHPLDCPICDKAGECTLQNYYMEHDQKSGRQEFQRFKKNKARDIGPTLILDQERCVLCDRCVRFLRDFAGEEQLYIAGRAHEAYVTTFPGKEVTSPYSLNVVDLCPVGALTSKDFRFATPTWFLKRTPSVCTTCSRGCSIEIDVDTRDNKVKRLRPRHNPFVNGYWMCDEGRLNYGFVNTDRVMDCVIDRNGTKFETSMENALSEAQSLLTGEGASGDAPGLAVLLSASCTLEEMFAAKQLSTARPGATIHVVRHIPDGVEDHLLRRSDRHPNVKGANLLGIPVVDVTSDSGTEGAKLEGDGKILVAIGFDVAIGEQLEKVFEKYSKVVMIAARETTLTIRAHVVVPGLTFAEKEGLFANFEGQIQELSPALDGLWDKKSPWEIVMDLASSLTGAGGVETIEDLRERISRDEAAFSGVDLNAVGPAGVGLEKQPA